MSERFIRVPKEPQYDGIADRFVDGKAEFFEHEQDAARDFILSNLEINSDSVVLDVGCGAGDLTAELEGMGFRRIIGIDPSPAMISRAREVVNKPENMLIGDFENTGLADSSVDQIISRFALHYVEDIDNAYKEMARVIKPGGKMIFAVDHPTADRVDGERFTQNDREYVRVKLYNGAVTIEFPMHNFSEYFSPQFLTDFDLVEIKEWTGTDREYQDGPNGLAFAAYRKTGSSPSSILA